MVRFQVVIDVRDPTLEATFWSHALGYEFEPPPEGYPTWSAYWTKVGVPPEDRSDEPDSIIDPQGGGPRIWFHVMDDPKVVKNRWHFDIRVGGRIDVPIAVRKERVEAEVARLERLGARRLETLTVEGMDHYAVAMEDPEGNEFDVN